jgi:ABC-type nitrate/sulfonate/bicarbonate transport system substrate-binding protein
MPVAGIHRRSLLAGLFGFTGLLVAAGNAHAQSSTFAAWGWPQPYERVSDRSIEWLKQKGWWPLQVAFQPPWSGQNNINIVMDKEGLLAKRGIEMKLTGFGSGPATNEVLVSGKVQVASAGNFPTTSLLDKQIPVKIIGVMTPNILHAVIVPLDSKIKSLADFKGANPPATIGIVTGSSSEFYLQMAAQVMGIKIGKDVILKNMPIGEQMALPKGIDAVVPWDAGASMIVHDRKNGRIVDTIYPYNMFEGNFIVRQELIDNVPDVVQALTDAYVESLLWARHDLAATVKHLQDDPNLKNFTRDILVQQTRTYNDLYKPTFVYPHARFWGEANEPIYNWLYEFKRIQRPLKAGDFEKSVDSRFMDKTFAKLGWTVPTTPPFIPAGWKGSLDKFPYPDYVTPLNLKEPQPFPEKGDLTKPWSFAGKTYNP